MVAIRHRSCVPSISGQLCACTQHCTPLPYQNCHYIGCFPRHLANSHFFFKKWPNLKVRFHKKCCFLPNLYVWCMLAPTFIEPIWRMSSPWSLLLPGTFVRSFVCTYVRPSVRPSSKIKFTLINNNLAISHHKTVYKVANERYCNIFLIFGVIWGNGVKG